MSNWQQYQREKGTNKERGYGAKWRKLRLRVLTRDKYLCQHCLKHAKLTTGNQCDHITPKSRGGSDAMTNLQTLCEPCHIQKTAKERTGGTISMGCDANGWPIDVNHPFNEGRGV